MNFSLRANLRAAAVARREAAALAKTGIVAVVFAAVAGLWAAQAAAAEPPNDPHFEKQQYLQQIHAEAAWDFINGKTLEPVVVAVVDTGVDAGHPDLEGRLVEGANILQPGRPPHDDNGHGTSVAGIIAAVSDNGQGIAGLAPNAFIMPVKAFGSDGLGEEEHLGEGIRFAVDHGADIIVLSNGFHLRSAYLAGIVEYASSKGVLLVAATGNDGAQVRYPAAFAAVVGVGGASITDEHKPLSNFGPEVDLIAPWYVYTTTNGGRYTYKEGTSMAAPQVAAIAALMLGLQPDLKPDGIRERLRQFAQRSGPGWNEQSGYGLLRADWAVSAAPVPDMYEPNDRREEAKPVSVTEIFDAGLHSDSDADWYVFDPPYRGEVTIRIRGTDSAPIPVQLVVDRGAGQPGQPYNVSDGQPVRLPSADGGAIRVMVTAIGPAPAAFPLPYRIETEFNMYADPYESNDRAFQAYTLPVRNTVVTGTFHKVDDQDWFSMKFESSGTLTLSLGADSHRIDPELYVAREDGTRTMTFDNQGEGDPEYSGPIPVEPGTYYIRVRNVKALFPLPVAGEYKLHVNYEKRFHDAFEPNDRSYQATTTMPGRLYRGVFDSVKDEDWFQLRIARQSLVAVDIADIPLNRYMHYALFTSATDERYSRTSPFGTTAMRMLHELEAGTYYIRLMTDAAYQDKQYGLSYAITPLVAGFSDIEQHWARESIRKLAERGIVNGYGNYRFEPGRLLSRAEAAELLFRAYQWKSSAGSASFRDVPASHWAYNSVRAAAANGIVRGYPDGAFRPNEPVTRAEMAAMAALAAKIPAESGRTVFADVPATHWASGYIYALANANHLNGFPNGAFHPNAHATRAEFAVLLAGLL